MSDASVTCAHCGYVTIEDVPACPRCLASTTSTATTAKSAPGRDEQLHQAPPGGESGTARPATHARAFTASLWVAAAVLIAAIILASIVVDATDVLDSETPTTLPQEQITIPDPAPPVTAVASTQPVP